MALAKGEINRFRTIALLGALCLLFILTLTRSSAALAQDDPPYIDEVRIFDPNFVMPHAEGLAFSPAADAFLLLEDLNAVRASGQPANLTMISPYEELIGSANLPVIANPINLAFDSKANRLFMYDSTAQELIGINANPDGIVDPIAINRFQVRQFGVQNPQGMAMDPESGALFILSQANSQIVWVKPDEQGSFDGAAALSEGRISRIDLSGLQLGEIRGLAFNPSDGHLYTLNPAHPRLVEISLTGELVADRDMSILDLNFRDPQGIVFAHSADRTDDPGQMHLFLMDSGLGLGESGPYWKYGPCLPPSNNSGQLPAPEVNEGRNPGPGPARIIEFTLTRPVVPLDPHP